MVPAMNTTLYCNKCGAPNSVEAQFCSHCGGALNPVPAARSPAEAVAVRHRSEPSQLDLVIESGDMGRSPAITPAAQRW